MTEYPEDLIRKTMLWRRRKVSLQEIKDRLADEVEAMGLPREYAPSQRTIISWYQGCGRAGLILNKNPKLLPESLI